MFVIVNDDILLETKILKKITLFVFGKEKRNPLTISMFILHLVSSFVFFLWHTLSFFVIKNHEIIENLKKISVKNLIKKRGEELGYSYSTFSENLITFHFISLIIWFLIIILGFFIFHNKKYSLISVLSLIFIYHIFMFYIFGITYYKEDTTIFDKITMIIIIVNSVLFHLQSLKKDDESIFN